MITQLMQWTVPRWDCLMLNTKPEHVHQLQEVVTVINTAPAGLVHGDVLVVQLGLAHDVTQLGFGDGFQK